MTWLDVIAVCYRIPFWVGWVFAGVGAAGLAWNWWRRQ